MSPSRTRRPVHRVRSRREVMTAIGGGVAVVLATALAVWLLRPGTPGVEGTGGMAARQPRAAWLVTLTVLAAGAFAWYVWKNQRRWRSRWPVILGIGVLAILVLAVVAGILWPGGLLRHTEPLPPLETDPLTSTSFPPELTTIPGETTVPGATTVPGTDTTAPLGTDTTVAPTPTSAPAP